MMQAGKDARGILKQERGVSLVESSVRPNLSGPVEVSYTVSAYWTPTRFYTGTDNDAAEIAFDQAVSRAPQRVPKAMR